MTDRESFETDAFTAVQSEVIASLPELRRRGLELGPLSISRQGEDDLYESELRVYAYRAGDLCDALELHVWRRGGPAASIGELGDWFRSHLNSLECSA